MNIVYVSREFGPITGGGIGTYIANACRAMADAGHRVFLLTDCVTDANRCKLPANVQCVPTENLPSINQGGCFSPNHEYSHRVYSTLKALCERESIETVEFAEYCGEGFVSIRAKRLLGEFGDQRLIVKCHTPLSLLESINEEFRFYAHITCDIAMEDYCVKYADLVTSPSRSLAAYFEQRTGRKGIQRCPYPLYLNFEDRPESFAQETIKTVRFFGSVQVRKGVDVFIEAAKQVLAVDPGFRFEIIGKERNAYYFHRSYTELLQTLIPESLRDRIVFRGEVPYEEVATLLQNSCMVVLPSRWENWANACLESMASGCVVLVSSSGGMAEMVRDGVHGYVVDPHDSSALAQRILALSSQPEHLCEVAAAAIEQARTLTDPTTTSQAMERNYARDVALFASPVPAEEPQPLVSVVIPFFNQSTTLAATLASVRASDYPSVEIVLVNDGSTSPSSIRCFEEVEGVLKVNQRNGGLSSARNAGIAASHGAFILPLDADDLIDPTYIRLAVEALLRNEQLAYVTCYTRNFEALNTPYYPLGYVPILMPFMNTSGKCSNVYRRSLFDGALRYDETMNSYEDWDFLLSLHDAGHEGDVIPRELFFYRRNFASMVYSVANPIRADLIHYMMLKHQSTWQQDAPKMAMILTRLWKETELNWEASSFALFQIYWGSEGCLDESRSRVMSYSPSGRVSISFTVPWNPEWDTLRLDPARSPIAILLRSLLVTDLLTGECLLEAIPGNDFKGLVVSGDAVFDGFSEEGCLRIISKGSDPQILLQQPLFRGAELRVCMDFDVIPH